MWQYVITGLILLAAVTYAVVRLVRYFRDPLRKCRNCSKDCGACGLRWS